MTLSDAPDTNTPETSFWEYRQDDIVPESQEKLRDMAEKYLGKSLPPEALQTLQQALSEATARYFACLDTDQNTNLTIDELTGDSEASTQYPLGSPLLEALQSDKIIQALRLQQLKLEDAFIEALPPDYNLIPSDVPLFVHDFKVGLGNCGQASPEEEPSAPSFSDEHDLAANRPSRSAPLRR